MTGYETILGVVLAGLKAAPPVVAIAANVRRAHRTNIPRDKTPAVHLIDGDDEQDRRSKCGRRVCKFTVSIFVRSDEGAKAADPYRIAVCARVENLTLPPDVLIKPPLRISVETEIADSDATRVDIDFECTYPTRSEWSLELPE